MNNFVRVNIWGPLLCLVIACQPRLPVSSQSGSSTLPRQANRESVQLHLKELTSFHTHYMNQSELAYIRLALVGEGIIGTMTNTHANNSVFIPVTSNGEGQANIQNVPWSPGRLRIVTAQGYDAQYQILPAFTAAGYYRSPIKAGVVTLMLSRHRLPVGKALSVMLNTNPGALSRLDLSSVQQLLDQTTGYQAVNKTFAVDPSLLDEQQLALLLGQNILPDKTTLLSQAQMMTGLASVEIKTQNGGKFGEALSLEISDPNSGLQTIATGAVSPVQKNLLVAPGEWILKLKKSNGTVIGQTTVSVSKTGLTTMGTRVFIVPVAETPVSYIISTFAGGGSGIGDGRIATAAQLNQPRTQAIDANGHVYIADTSQNRIRKVDKFTGLISTIAGNGVAAFSGDGGPASAAQVSAPSGLIFDSAGHLYIADYGNQRIRKIDKLTGIISTVVGTGVGGFLGDGGAATAARINDPQGLVFDSLDNLYISDYANACIRKVTKLTGVISTVAGMCTNVGSSGDGGAATAARLNNPQDVAVDSSDTLYIADYLNNRIRKVDKLTGIISTVAGTGTAGFSGDGGAASAARLNTPLGLTFDSSDNMYIADFQNNRIRKVDKLTGIISTFAGTGVAGYEGDGGLATAARLRLPFGLRFDSTGQLHVADYSNHSIRKINPTSGIITTIAGSFKGDTGAATFAELNTPIGAALDSTGYLYVMDGNHHRLRKIHTQTGTILAVAGTTMGFSGDSGMAVSAQLNTPKGVGIDSQGNIFIADANNHRIRKIDTNTGVISTIAGTGVAGALGDGGLATAAQLRNPHGIAFDSEGHIYIADALNHRIRKIDKLTGMISTVVGTGVAGFLGNGGAASAARLNEPRTVDFDSSGNMYIADAVNHCIRKVDKLTGFISTVAGTGTVAGFLGDGGPATAARMNVPSSARVDYAGNIYIADLFNHRIRRVDRLSGLITTIAGTGANGFAGDGGPATAAQLNATYAVTLDGTGNIFIVDRDNHRIRKLAPQ